MIRQSLFQRLMKGAFAAAVSLTMLSSSPSAWAAEEKAAEEDKAVKSIEAINLAEQLLRYGRETNDPAALILATRILHKNPTSDAKATVEGGTKVADVETDLKAIVVEARAARKALKLKEEEGKALDILIDSLGDQIKEAPRGAVGGVKKFGVLIIPAGGKTTISFNFVVGQPAIVTVQITQPPLQDKAYQSSLNAKNLCDYAIAAGYGAQFTFLKAKPSIYSANKFKGTEGDGAFKAACAQGDKALRLAREADLAGDGSAAQASYAACVAAAKEGSTLDPIYAAEMTALVPLAKRALDAMAPVHAKNRTFADQMSRFLVPFNNDRTFPIPLILAGQYDEYLMAMLSADNARASYLAALVKIRAELAKLSIHAQITGVSSPSAKDGASLQFTGVPVPLKSGDKTAVVSVTITNKSPRAIPISGYTN